MFSDKSTTTDLIDKNYLQLLQDSIARATNLSIRFLDATGAPLTTHSDVRPFFALVNAAAVRPYPDLTDASVPIYLDGLFLGQWIISGIRFQTDAQEASESAASQWDRGNSPSISLSKFQTLLEFLPVLTKEIISLMPGDARQENKSLELFHLSERLASSMEVLSAFMDAAGAGIYVSDFFTGEIIMNNKAYADVLGRDSRELTDRCCYEMVGSGFRCSCCPYQKLIDQKGRPLGAYILEDHCGEYNFWPRSAHRAARWIDGRLVHIVAVMAVSQRRQGSSPWHENESFTLAGKAI